MLSSKSTSALKVAVNFIVLVKFPIRTIPVWELQAKHAYSERKPVPRNRTYIDGDDDDYSPIKNCNQNPN